MIVDTSNEIGGDGDIPHPGIGNARRLQVPNQDMQHKVRDRIYAKPITCELIIEAFFNTPMSICAYLFFFSLNLNQVLIEAVENHMPQAIVIDEIGTKLEAMAASTIAQRGIQLVATAHGITIENLIMNPSLDMLVGGVQVMICCILFYAM